MLNSNRKSSSEPGQTSAYSKDFHWVLQWYSVYGTPVGPEGGLVRRRDWTLCGLAEAVELTSCGIAFNCESNAAWELEVFIEHIPRAEHQARMHAVQLQST